MPSLKLDSVAISRAEARLLWPHRWVYVALSTELAEPGQILPFTLPDVGVHLERMADGTVEARLNRAQQGGCSVIPQQCHGGAQVRCPQMACAFSRDSLPVITATTPGLERLHFQFKGDRPELLPLIDVREQGGVIAVRVLPTGPGADGDQRELRPDLLDFASERSSWWHEIPENWKVVAHHLNAATECVSESMVVVGPALFHSPNAITLRGDGWGGFVILQPLAHKLTRCRISLLAAPAAAAEAHRLVLVSIVSKAQRAALLDGIRLSHAGLDDVDEPACLMREPGRSLFGTSSELGGALAMIGHNGYRLNPRFGFAGG
ncbi:hypothetical protein [Mesorhizobium sp. CO1-1-8]|uniref:hypothetical protein n=1 Tax=Mesorhizobium sp. CO1-1-8 TaxID=2876631 RepID=UPI001CD083BC|nr:hypothetical protein [Mesorhizobium sp. CO1-1-8]MBZ9772460.1 hypothetical protein [Mesorhizobium sp. CO1-1-8]